MTTLDVLFVMRNGKRMFGGAVDMVFMKRTDTNPSVAKVIVSQKVAKKAVDRHKIQRQLREITRYFFSLPYGVGRGYDIVVIARSSAYHMPFKELKKSVERIFDHFDPARLTSARFHTRAN